jgi:putative selenate reductase
MTRHGLDVVVKLNPTLLGFERVAGIVSGELGYEEIRLRRTDFEADLSFPRALELIGELDTFARDHGRRFGIKLTNTLVVENHRGFLPDDPMYLSGPPLHVVAMTLLDELHRALPGVLRVDGQDGTVEVSFSAGVTKKNAPRMAGLGVAPVTVCSDLLKPGGYGRLKPMLGAIAGAMAAEGCPDLAGWRARQLEVARAAGHAGPIAAYVADLHDPGRNEAYTRAGTAQGPRRVDHTLQTWGCVACNVCVTVCPNDAFFRLPTPDGMEVSGKQQYLLFAELCNQCGNCMVFCPEEGDPAAVKPALFLDPDRFSAGDRPGFLLSRLGDRVGVIPSAGLEAEVEPLGELLNAPEGLPVALADLATAPR